jgi:Tfp pilus assembly protein PilZ
MSKNRRKHPRVRARGLAAHLRTQRGRAPCVVENVSMGGIFVRTDRLEEVGADIFVDIVKPGWKKQLTIAARITSRVDAIDGRISKRMPGMGVQFTQLDEKQHERLASLLRELGAPDETAEVTLAEESTELELRALELEEQRDELLDPQPEPQWSPQSLVEEAIAGALREAALPPPGPVELAEEAPPPRSRPPPPAARASAPPPVAPAPAPAAVSSDESARLMTQLRGMAMQLSDLQQQLSQRDLEIERLKEELETTKSALERALRRN